MSARLASKLRVPAAESSRAGVCWRCVRQFSSSFSSALRSAAQDGRDEAAKEFHHGNKDERLVQTLLDAATLRPSAKPFSGQDPMAGWKHTPGPSTRRNAGQPFKRPRSSYRQADTTLFEGHMDPRLAEEWTPRRESDGPAEIEPGDMVEVRRARKALFGMTLPVQMVEATGHSSETSSEHVILLSTGEMVTIQHANDVVLHLPAYHPREEAVAAAPVWSSRPNADVEAERELGSSSDDSGAAESATSHADRIADEQTERWDVARLERRAKLAAVVRDLQRCAETEAQRLLPAFQALYLSAVHSKDSQARSTISTYEVAIALETYTAEQKSGKKFKGTPVVTRPVYIATHQLLMSESTIFLADASAHRTTSLFAIRPNSEHDIIKVVTGWLRAPIGEPGYGAIEGFAKRATAARAWVAKKAASAPSAGVPSAEHAPDALKWSKTDLSIIAFLRISLAVRRELQSNETTAVASHILKRVGMHFPLTVTNHGNEREKASRTEGPSAADLSLIDSVASTELGHYRIHRFLCDIGELPTWYNMIRLDAAFQALTRRPIGVKPTVQITEGADEQIVDGLETVRHDFGDLPVYVIDEASARELDDGVSIERIPSEPDHLWLHVHIADPTAVLDPKSPFSQQAAHQHLTLYFPERSWPLLPPMGAGTAGLRSSTAQNSSIRTLTFSAKVDLSSGAVDEVDVRAAVVRNIQVQTYSNVGALLEGDSSSNDDAAQQDLRQLQLVTRLLRQRRGHVPPFQPSGSVVVSLSGLPSSPEMMRDIFPEQQLDRPTAFSGMPIVQLSTLRGNDKATVLAQSLVEESMILAGRIAGKWAHERQIPLPYRGQALPSPEVVELCNRLHREAMERDGPDAKIQYSEMLKWGVKLSPAHSGITPAAHFSMGITGLGGKAADPDALSHSGYTRSTSPLRRYTDLVTHWQLKSALQPQSAGKVGTPWSSHDLSNLLPGFSRLETHLKQTERQANLAWAIFHLERTLEADPMDVILGPHKASVVLDGTRTVLSSLEARVRVQVHSLGVPALCEWGRREAPPKMGDELNVRIIKVVRAGSRSGILVERIE